jgi:hypothetical protein
MRVLLLACALALALPGVASAYSENYGGYTICGSPSGTCYAQSFGAHTFRANAGTSIGQATYLACQLFNGSGVNVVGHGYGACTTTWTGGAYVWARVYNESAFSDTVYGSAGT